MIGAGRRVQQNNGIFPQYDKKEPGRKGRAPQTVDKDPGSHSRTRVFVHNKFCNIVEILTFLVEFTV